MQIHLRREKTLDILRGIAVLLMICAHALAFFYNGDNPILGFTRTFGDTVAFVLFVFVAGATTYFAYLDTPDVGDHTIRPSRIAKLMLGYYLVAYVSAIEDFAKLTIDQWPQLFAKILLLIELPDYSEFILTFVLFTILIVLIQGELKFFANSKYKIVIPAIIAYLLGYLIYNQVESEPLVYYTSLIAGHEGLYRFPVLQYLPVFLSGIYIGKLTDKDNTYKHKTRLLIILTLVAIGVVIASALNPTIAAFPYNDAFNRWPPSIGFLSVGMALALGLVTILSGKFRFPGFFEKPLVIMGEHALGFYMVHMIIYEIVDLISPYKTTNNLITILIILFTIILSYLLIKLQIKSDEKPVETLSKTNKNGTITIGLFVRKHAKKMQNSARNLIIITVILSIALIGIFWVLKCRIAPHAN